MVSITFLFTIIIEGAENSFIQLMDMYMLFCTVKFCWWNGKLFFECFL